MVNLEKYKNSFFPGVIENTRMQVLKDYLGDNLDAFMDGAKQFPDNVKTKDEKRKYMEKRVEATVLVVEYSAEIEGKKTTNQDFLNIPQVTGFGKSKLSAFREKNDLPWDTEQWKGKPIKTYPVNGFLKLFPET